MGTIQHPHHREARRPLRDRRPLAGCDLRALINLQHEWGMIDPLVFGLRLGADAVCLRADVSVASAIANLRNTLVSAAATLSMVEDNCIEGDPSRHVVHSVRQSLREGLGMLGIMGRAVDDDEARDADPGAVDFRPKAPAPRANEGAIAVA